MTYTHIADVSADEDWDDEELEELWEEDEELYDEDEEEDDLWESEEV